MSWCLVGLGSNVGDRAGAIALALEELGRRPQIAVVRQSRLIETVPVGGPPGQSLFLNAAALLQTSLEPLAILSVLQEVEAKLGRQRAVRWGSRTIDLDLLLYDQLVLSTPSLTLPHPRMAWRRFVLEPASEIAGAMIHPVIGWSIARLWQHVRTARDYVAICGPIAVGQTSLSQRLASTAGACWLVDPGPSVAFAAALVQPSSLIENAELESLARRARLLAADASVWREPVPFWVSDFWLDQSLAHFRAWLPQQRWQTLKTRWEEATRGVVRPKLVVAIDVSMAALRDCLAASGSVSACSTGEALERFLAAWEWCLGREEVGPVLHLSDPVSDLALEEVLAAVDAMRSP